MNSRYDDWAYLSDEEYQTTKQEMVDKTLVDLQRYIPDIKNKVDWIEAATPNFVRYTLHTKGTSFGTKFEGLDVSRTIYKEVAGVACQISRYYYIFMVRGNKLWCYCCK